MTIVFSKRICLLCLTVLLCSACAPRYHDDNPEESAQPNKVIDQVSETGDESMAEYDQKAYERICEIENEIAEHIIAENFNEALYCFQKYEAFLCKFEECRDMCQYTKAFLLLKIGKSHEATLFLIQQAHLYPTDAYLFWTAFLLLCINHEYATAEVMMTNLLSQNPESFSTTRDELQTTLLYVYLAYVFIAQNKIEEAIRECENGKDFVANCVHMNAEEKEEAKIAFNELKAFFLSKIGREAFYAEDTSRLSFVYRDGKKCDFQIIWGIKWYPAAPE